MISSESIDILCIDIGGTNTRFCPFSITLSPKPEDCYKKESSFWVKSAEYQDFSSLVQATVGILDRSYRYVVVCAAGKVIERKYCKPTHLNWHIDLRILSDLFPGAEIAIINDFVAQACASLSPLILSRQVLLSGTIDPAGTMGIVGAGTGFGQAFLTRNIHNDLIPVASEGGHIHLAIESEQEFKICRSIADDLNLPYLTYDDVICGRGLTALHRYFFNQELSPQEVAKNFTSDSPVVTFFARFYGRAVRDTALQGYCSGGVFLAGGIAVKNAILVEHPEFKTGVRNSSSHREFIESIQVTLFDDEESGLHGCAVYAKEILMK